MVDTAVIEALEAAEPPPSPPEPRAEATATAEQVAPFGNVPLAVDVELDRKLMTVREILAITQGSVLGMTRSAGENIDIRVGGALLGFGEIVVLEEKMGVRITDFHEED